MYGAIVGDLAGSIYEFNQLKKIQNIKMNIDIKYIPFTKFNTTCEETIVNCLYVLYDSNSFENAIRKTLLMGGDTDTNCAIVGSMAEAMHGIDSELIEKVNEKIPQKFVKILSRTRR